MSRCGFWESAISRNPSVPYDGPRKKTAIFFNFPISYLASIQSFSWRCRACHLLDSTFSDKTFQDIFENKYAELLNGLMSKFNPLKDDFKTKLCDKLSEVIVPTSTIATVVLICRCFVTTDQDIVEGICRYFWCNDGLGSWSSCL